MDNIMYSTYEDARNAIKERFRPGFYVEVSKDLYVWTLDANVSYVPLHICKVEKTNSEGFRSRVSGVYKFHDLLECTHCKQRWPKEIMAKIETIKGLKQITS